MRSHDQYLEPQQPKISGGAGFILVWQTQPFKDEHFHRLCLQRIAEASSIARRTGSAAGLTFARASPRPMKIVVL